MVLKYERFTPELGSRAWMDKALCKDMGNELFFPEKGEDIRRAKRLCARCPVRLDCLEYGLRVNSGIYDQGVWGGTSPKQRERIRAERRARNRQATAPVSPDSGTDN